MKRMRRVRCEDFDRHRTDALILLEVSADEIAAAPKISHVLEAAKIKDPWEYIEGSEQPEARALLAVRARLSKRQAGTLEFEAFCVAAKISPKKALAMLTMEVFDQAGKASALLAASQHPAVTEATIQAALSPLGTPERKMLHLHAEFLPVPKTSIINVRGNHAVIGGEQKNLVLPPVEEGIRRLGDRFNQRAIAPAPVAPVPLIVEDEG